MPPPAWDKDGLAGVLDELDQFYLLEILVLADEGEDLGEVVDWLVLVGFCAVFFALDYGFGQVLLK